MKLGEDFWFLIFLALVLYMVFHHLMFMETRARLSSVEAKIDTMQVDCKKDQP